MVKGEDSEVILPKKDKIGGILVVGTALVIGIISQSLMLWKWQGVADERIANLQARHDEFRSRIESQLNEIRMELVSNRIRSNGPSRPGNSE